MTFVEVPAFTREARYFDAMLTSLQARAPQVVLYSDSQAAIAMARGQGINQRNKYFAHKLLYLREQLLDERYILRHVAGKFNVADIGTKPLPAPQFARLRDVLLNETPFSLGAPTIDQLLSGTGNPNDGTTVNAECSGAAAAPGGV